MSFDLSKKLKNVQKDPAVYEVDLLGSTDEELVGISQATSIGLALDEMQRVRDYFKAQGRNPRDIELESLGQAWSEHCCYKSSKPVLKAHVYGIHEHKLMAREDAGVIAFNDEYAYVVKIESHNHPSAIEPYGGAATGIGGVVRDVVCMGAQPIALVDPLFFGPLDTAQKDLPAGTKHPRYLFGGVVAGIRDYGNRIGIPTVAGLISFHPKFITNPLVNVGCVGIMKKEHLIHSRVGNVGDKYILFGGKTGRDGIHGVTFASKDLEEDAEETSRSAVQLGDPITKEPVIHVALECNEKGFLTGMKDLGGGGLSCVCGEMALDAGVGAVIQLDQVHLKEPGMKPWEIWVSESQERMMVTVRPENVEKVLAVARKWDVEARVVGEATADKTLRVKWKTETIFEMDTEFLYGGPVYNRPYETRKLTPQVTPPAPQKEYSGMLLKLLAAQNIASKETVIRQYDHTVRGATVIEPLQGKLGVQVGGDAAVLKPVADSFKGLAITCDINPALTDVDPYWGTVSGMDEMVRNLAAVGARVDCVADNLNLPNPQKPNNMGDIYECARGMGDAARALGIPFVSGNVSMYNESAVTPVPVTPSLLGVGIVQDIRRAVTVDLKAPGNTLYLVGETRDEMGGSEYYRLAGGKSNVVPRASFDELKASSETVVRAIEAGYVASCHDVSNGGLAVALAEMAIGGDLGLTADLTATGTLRGDVKLFSESNTRWVIEARDAEAVEALFRDRRVKLTPIGTTGGDRVVIKDGGATLVDVPVAAARVEYTEGLRRLV
ncbi:MAG TPA: phosphoribosylformylglycinamidine synthase subunit PurL [Candidatus Thermoplasmatota archaeon]|nr:phosphoribosylformylglycinamidine synthase subunit PurL [Candidatus Thermoplasmatota archaeon]